MFKIKPLYLILCSTALFSITTPCFANWFSHAPLYQPRLTLVDTVGDDSLASVDLMYPFTGNARSLWYGDVGATIAGSDNARGAYLGLGYRHIRNPYDYILGGYAFVDRWRSPNFNYYNQLTLGAEALGQIWDFRGNFYLPFGDKEKQLSNISFTSPFYASGHKILSNNAIYTTEIAERGFDVEVGHIIPHTDTVRGYLGYYHYGFGSDPNVDGPRVRLEYRYSNNLTFTASDQYDSEQGNQFLVGLRLSIGGVSNTNSHCLESRMMDYIIRNHVTTVEKKIPGQFVSPEDFLYVDEANTDAGNGTIEDPYQDIIPALDDASADSNPNTKYIYLFSDNGQAFYSVYNPTFENPQNSTYIIGPNQVITSSAVPFIYQGQTVTNLTGGGGTPLIGGGFVVSNNDGINHVELSGDGLLQYVGIYGDGVNNITLDSINLDSYYVFSGGTAPAGMANPGQNGGNGSDGSDGAMAAGIYIKNAQNVSVTNIQVSNIQGGDAENGGDGGAGGNGTIGNLNAFNGGNGGKGGNGGIGAGIWLENVNHLNFANITIENVHSGNGGNGGAGGPGGTAANGGTIGGNGGNGGNAGAAGNGGDAYGVNLLNSTNAFISNVLVEFTTYSYPNGVTAGNGGTGGVGGNGTIGGTGTSQNGNGGNGGLGGTGGNGGTVFAFDISNISLSANNIITGSTGTVSIYSGNFAGNGGDGGNGGVGGTGFITGSNGTGGNGGNGGNATDFSPGNTTVPPGTNWYDGNLIFDLVVPGNGGNAGSPSGTNGNNGTATVYSP